jgi:hypothetical protein
MSDEFVVPEPLTVQYAAGLPGSTPRASRGNSKS